MFEALATVERRNREQKYYIFPALAEINAATNATAWNVQPSPIFLDHGTCSTVATNLG